MEFRHRIEDHGQDVIVYETDLNQKATVVVENDVPVVYLNREACLFLARLFAQLGHGNYRSGFHVHLGRDFDPEKEEAFRVVLE